MLVRVLLAARKLERCGLLSRGGALIFRGVLYGGVGGCGRTVRGVADRVLVALRLGRSGLARVDELAARGGVSRSEMLRRLLALGEVEFRNRHPHSIGVLPADAGPL